MRGGKRIKASLLSEALLPDQAEYHAERVGRLTESSELLPETLLASLLRDEAQYRVERIGLLPDSTELRAITLLSEKAEYRGDRIALLSESTGELPDAERLEGQAHLPLRSAISKNRQQSRIVRRDIRSGQGVSGLSPALSQPLLSQQRSQQWMGRRLVNKLRKDRVDSSHSLGERLKLIERTHSWKHKRIS